MVPNQKVFVLWFLVVVTGALIYWMDAEASEAQINKDRETMVTIGGLL